MTCLADLFYNIVTQKKKVGTIAPKKFIARLKKENELFDNFMQQDAHEFLNYLLNSVADLLQVVVGCCCCRLLLSAVVAVAMMSTTFCKVLSEVVVVIVGGCCCWCWWRWL